MPQFDVARVHHFARSQALLAREKAQEGFHLPENMAYWDSVAVRLCETDPAKLTAVLQALLFAQERELARALEADAEVQHEATGKWVAEAQANVTDLKELLSQMR